MSRAMRPVKRPMSLHESVQASIQDFIRQNGLKPNDLLQPEAELARTLGVSRNSVREAVKALESVGVLQTQHGTGVRVASFSFTPLLDKLPYAMIDGAGIDEVAELLEIRMVLESGMIGRAIESMDGAAEAELLDILSRMREKAERGESFPEEDRAFHRVLFAGLRNKSLLKLLDVFWLAFSKAMEVVDIHDTEPMKTYGDHAFIVDAVVAKDVAAARSALVDHHYAGLASRLRRARGES